MLTALKRDQSRGARSGGTTPSNGGGARETDATAPLDSGGILRMQQQVMSTQDRDLEDLERSVVGTRHVALQINEEAELHNRLLEGLDADVTTTSGRLAEAQRKLRYVMREGGSCKAKLMVFLMLVILIVVLLVGFKIVVRL
jgi:syntaxin of plants SYP5